MPTDSTHIDAAARQFKMIATVAVTSVAIYIAIRTLLRRVRGADAAATTGSRSNATTDAGTIPTHQYYNSYLLPPTNPQSAATSIPASLNDVATIDASHTPDYTTPCSYIQLDLPADQLANHPTTISEQHVHILKHAIRITQHELYIGISSVYVDDLSLDDINYLFGLYYVTLSDMVQQVKGKDSKIDGLLFSTTVLLPQRRRSLHSIVCNTLCDLQTIICPTDNDAALNQINHLRHLSGLPPVQQYVYQHQAIVQPASSSTATSVTSPTSSQHRLSHITRKQPKRYRQVVLGGTFDHSHIGHKLLLSLALHAATHKLVIGLSADELLVKKKHAEDLQSWSIRKQWLLQWCAIVAPHVEVECVDLHDMYGPSGDRAELEALVVSEETAAGGQKVNEKRAENNVPALDMLVVKLAKPANVDDSLKVSSTQIRAAIVSCRQEKQAWLKQQWHDLCEQQLFIEPSLIDEWWQKLITRYSSDNQRDIACTHMAHMLQLAQRFGSLLADIRDVQLAIFFVDSIDDIAYAAHNSSKYSSIPTTPNANGTSAPLSSSPPSHSLTNHSTPPRMRRQNTMSSMDLFHGFCKAADLQPTDFSVTEAIVTARHSETMGMSNAHLNDFRFTVDFDVSPMAYASFAYSEYWQAVMEDALANDESLNERQYVDERCDHIQLLLDSERICETRTFQQHYEVKARYTLRNEVKRLRNQR